MIKFKTKKTSDLINPIFIVGINPGKQRKSSMSYTVWEGNRSGDFINNVVKSIPNLYLTNICNHKINGKLSKKNIHNGLIDLINDILTYQPVKIICLGKFSYYYCKKLKTIDIELIKIEHPSYILRFNKNKETYKKKLLNELSTIN